ncbi:MAG: hypothetical protein GC191_09550 [Azospirillum sp.]|nr:hypothetical protein [Azospirillum sp.]
MLELHQHPDGILFLRTDAGTYRATPAEFAADALSLPGPPTLAALPPGYIERLYRPSGRHILVDTLNQVTTQPSPWPAGDALLARAADLIAVRAAAEAAATGASPPPSPLWCTKLQFRRALRQAGLLATVQAAIAAAGPEAAESWEYATAIWRTDPMVDQIALLLGKTSDETDALFQLARTL